jgi:AcrR family transcriptional regulator
MAKTPRQRRKEKNKSTILDAATQLIFKKGIENVSMRDIAQASDYSPAALYKYFDNKEAIIRQIMMQKNQHLMNMLDEVDKQLSPDEYLVELCLTYINYGLKDPAYITLLNSLGSGRRSKNDSVDQQSPYLIFLNAVLFWAEQENIKLTDQYGSEEITYSIWSLTHGAVTLRLNQLKDFEGEFESADRRAIEAFLIGLNNFLYE